MNMISLNTIDPPKTFELSTEDLARNLFVAGQVGSGKTLLLNNMMKQLIQNPDLENRPGLVVYDFKGDDAVDKVRHWANQVGRQDVLVMDGSPGAPRMSWASSLRSMDDVDPFVDAIRCLLPKDEGNAYFVYASQKRLWSFFTLYRAQADAQASEGPPNDFELMERLINFWESRSAQNDLIEWGQDHLECHGNAELKGIHPCKLSGQQLRLILVCALQGLKEYMSLDSRTKSNEQSSITNYLSQLFSMATFPFILPEEGDQVLDPGPFLAAGGILVVKLPYNANPSGAKMVGRLIKAEIYRYIQSRGLSYQSPGRYIGIVCDEYPLIATSGNGRYSDSHQMQTMRSNRAFLMASAQSYEGLKKVLDKETEMFLANCGNLIFLKSTDPDMARVTHRFFGEPPARIVQTNFSAFDPDELYKAQYALEKMTQNYPYPETLAALNICEGFLVHASQGRIREALFFEPEYFNLKDSLATGANKPPKQDKGLPEIEGVRIMQSEEEINPIPDEPVGLGDLEESHSHLADLEESPFVPKKERKPVRMVTPEEVIAYHQAKAKSANQPQTGKSVPKNNFPSS